MEIRDLRFFCLTAELEHVTRAADKLGVAQPFLTKVIKQLEEEVGVDLFDNIGRKIKLNKYGEIVYSHGKKILAELDNLRDDLDVAIDRQARTIRIITNGGFHYPELFLAYQITNSDYTLSITTATREDAANALRSGEADYVICSPPLNEDVEKGIVTEVIFKELACIMLPPGHPLLEAGVPIKVEDLVGMPLVATPKDTSLRINIERVMDKYDYHPPIVCESSDLELIVRSVKSGLGFAIIPRTMIFSKPSIRKYCLDVDIPGAFGEIAISYSETSSDARDSSNFLNFTKTFVNNFYQKYYRAGVEHILEA